MTKRQNASPTYSPVYPMLLPAVYPHVVCKEMNICKSNIARGTIDSQSLKTSIVKPNSFKVSGGRAVSYLGGARKGGL